MERDIRPFNGGFKKDIHYTCYGGLKKANFYVRFDKSLFKAVSAEIEQTLGKKVDIMLMTQYCIFKSNIRLSEYLGTMPHGMKTVTMIFCSIVMQSRRKILFCHSITHASRENEILLWLLILLLIFV